MRVIGLMSGTSHDAIDAAAADIEFAGDEVRFRPLGALSVDYPAELRGRIAAALPPAATSMAEVCALDTGIGQAFGHAARRANAELCAGKAELAVSHGQTLYHWIEDGRALGSLQLGQPAWIAELSGLAVVADLRPRDIAAGGQGAPLVSLFDTVLLRGREGIPAALNLGGIANLTVVGADEVRAFDTGPANALIDAVVRHVTDGARDFDVDGALAAAGTPDEAVLDRLLADPYYRRRPPKTTGKERFHLDHVRAAVGDLDAVDPADLVATLTLLTARTVAEACRAHRVTEVIASGGGVRNPVLMARLAAEAPGIRWRTSESVGVPAAAKEAHAFALLGFLTVHSVPGTEPTCTGARARSVLGSITPGTTPLRLPEPGRMPRRLRIVD